MRDLIEACTEFKREARPDFEKIVEILLDANEKIKTRDTNNNKLERTQSEQDIKAAAAINQ